MMTVIRPSGHRTDGGTDGRQQISYRKGGGGRPFLRCLRLRLQCDSGRPAPARSLATKSGMRKSISFFGNCAIAIHHRIRVDNAGRGTEAIQSDQAKSER